MRHGKGVDGHLLMHRHPHGNEASCDVINKLATIFYVVDAMADDVMLGLACEMADFEDAVMATTVLRIWADRIVARNLADYKNGTIPAVSPARCSRRLGGRFSAPGAFLPLVS